MKMEKLTIIMETYDRVSSQQIHKRVHIKFNLKNKVKKKNFVAFIS